MRNASLRVPRVSRVSRHKIIKRDKLSGYLRKKRRIIFRGLSSAREHSYSKIKRRKHFRLISRSRGDTVSAISRREGIIQRRFFAEKMQNLSRSRNIDAKISTLIRFESRFRFEFGKADSNAASPKNYWRIYADALNR